MGIVLNWNSTYPGGGIDDTTINFPTMVDVVHNVMASHVNALASAVIALETAVGINGGLTVREADTSPSVTPVHTIVFSNGSVTDLGSGTVQVTTGGGGSVSPFPFRPEATDFGTPVVTGTITGGVTVTDVTGAAIGSLYDYVRIRAVDPQAGAFVQVPITLPVTPLPDRFAVSLTFFTLGPPAADFNAALAFVDSTGDRGWQVFHDVDVAPSARPVIRVLESDTGVTGATWDFPTATLGSSVDARIDIEKVAPFTATPQISIDIAARGLAITDPLIASSAAALNATSGTISAGWVGEDFETTSLIVIYPSTMVGNVDLFMILEFMPHIKDR